MKLQVYVCGEGLGHASRSMAAAESLIKRGHEVKLYAYGSSRRHIEHNGFNVTDFHPELKLLGDGGALDIKASVKATLAITQPLALPKLISQMREDKPDLVISDSYFLPAIAAKLVGIPVYMIVNQINTYHYFNGLGLTWKILAWFIKHAMGIVFKSVDKIIIPDFPPPWTVCADNIENFSSKIEYIGPLVRKTPSEVKAVKLKKPQVLSLIGGFGYRENILLKVIEAAKQNPDINFTILPGPNTDSSKLKNNLGNVEVIDYPPSIFPYLKSTDLVIAPGGHSTMMESLTYGVPLISFPDLLHNEQQNNASKLDELKLGRKLDYNTTADEISKTINELLVDKEVKENCLNLMEQSSKLDASSKLAELIEE